jgi:O-methyltransferase involved in polyketide biosynthesis
MSAISPTAHYTGYVWARNGLSHEALATQEGRLLYESLRPVMTVSGLLGRGTLEAYLLARHTAIDALLERAIEQHGVTQVVEVASGLSPRGWRFTQRYGSRITYIETDLPEMVERKQRALERMGAHHRVMALDALEEDGLAALADELDRGTGLAIVTEGLLGYLPTDAVNGLWRRFAAVLSGFAGGSGGGGRYISDLHLAGVQTREVRAFRVLLSLFVRGRVYLHFQDAEEAVQALGAAGFGHAELHRAVDVGRANRDPGARLSNIIEASTT